MGIKNAHKIKQEKINLFLEKYNEGLSIVEISKLFNVSSTTVWRYVVEAGINRSMSDNMSKHTLNRTYFDVIDTEHKAYFLGLLYGDGSIDYGVKNNRIIITMLEEDALEVLEIFRKELNLSRELFYSKQTLKQNGELGEKLKTLLVYNKHMCNSLKNLGMVKNKSDLLYFPNINPIFYRHFVRGFFDADGYVGNKSGFRCSLCSNSQQLLLDIQSVVNIPSKIYVRQQKNLSYTLSFGRINTATLFHNWLYLNSNVFLSRKKNCTYLSRDRD